MTAEPTPPVVLEPDEPPGARLLDEVRAELAAYVAFPSPQALDAVALWAAATHAQPAWEHATRLVVKSPLKRCGKTRLQEVVGDLAYSTLRTTNISPAALVRSIDEADPPTLVLDEADAVFGKRSERAEGAEDLRGILNSGHSRGWPYIRWDANTRKREVCATFAMAVLGGIGDLPDTIEDRAVVVAMRRRAPGETVRAYRARRARPTLQALRDRLHAWVAPHVEALAEAEPDLPAEDRDADVWEPLVAVADLAGGEWPDRARKACQAHATGTEPDEATLGERLLADLYNVWGDVDHRFTTDVLARLHAVEESPWADWYGRALNARDLARLLRPYGVTSRTVRDAAGGTAKGYARADLWDAWRRYVRPAQSRASQASHEGETPGQPRDGLFDDERHTSVTTASGQEADEPCDGTVTAEGSQSVTGSDQRKRGDVTDVTDVTEGGREPTAAERMAERIRREGQDTGEGSS